MKYEKEILRRRTFAIISHPDAGKTTLTEKLLLFGGAIQTAGAVKSNKIKKHATSDFMEIERQRGISVATSVMTFEYQGCLVNLLDTPGHKDFAEDTYRTLTAVDSVILVIDSVNGVEDQTRRLMEVCRMRDTPVIVFINKMDRDGKNRFDLLEEIEKELNLALHPMAWPINSGKDFKGVYDLSEKNLVLFAANTKAEVEDTFVIENLEDTILEAKIGETDAKHLRDDVELIEGVHGELNVEDYLQGKVAPVFFGSAVNNFGVREMLNTFIRIAPTPGSRETSVREVEVGEDKFSGFIFKIHANLDPKHRDRIGFMRVCSGRFERNKYYRHVRLDKDIRFSNPYSFLARSKDVIEDTWESLSSIGFSQKVQHAYTKPGRWSDPDMLIVGQVGWGENLHQTRLNPDEQYTHISLWCLLSAPLLIGCDISKMDDFTVALLSNDEVIAVNQDILGKEAKQVLVTPEYQVWMKPLEDGSHAIGIFNLTEKYKSIAVKWSELGLATSGTVKVRDLWRQKNLGAFTDQFSPKVAPHGVTFIKVSE